jgi:hypothetical protein
LRDAIQVAGLHGVLRFAQDDRDVGVPNALFSLFRLSIFQLSAIPDVLFFPNLISWEVITSTPGASLEINQGDLSAKRPSQDARIVTPEGAYTGPRGV